MKIYRFHSYLTTASRGMTQRTASVGRLFGSVLCVAVRFVFIGSRIQYGKYSKNQWIHAMTSDCISCCHCCSKCMLIHSRTTNPSCDHVSFRRHSLPQKRIKAKKTCGCTRRKMVYGIRHAHPLSICGNMVLSCHPLSTTRHCSAPSQTWWSDVHA